MVVSIVDWFQGLVESLYPECLNEQVKLELSGKRLPDYRFFWLVLFFTRAAFRIKSTIDGICVHILFQFFDNNVSIGPLHRFFWLDCVFYGVVAVCHMRRLVSVVCLWGGLPVTFVLPLFFCIVLA